MFNFQFGYFERVMNSKKFLSSLFLGIFGGTVFSLFLSKVLEDHFPDIHWLIYLTVFVVFLILSYWVSHKSETIISSISGKIDTNNFVTLFNTFSDKISNVENKVFQDRINAIKSALTDSCTLESANVSMLQNYVRDLQNLSTDCEGNVKRFINDLCAMLMDLQNIKSLLIASANQKKNFYTELGYYVETKNDSVLIKKVKSIWFDKTLISYTFKSNLSVSLLNPIRCEIKIDPFTSFGENKKLSDSIQKYLIQLVSTTQLRKLGLGFPLFNSSDYLDEKFEKLSNKTTEKIEESLSILISEVRQETDVDVNEGTS